MFCTPPPLPRCGRCGRQQRGLDGPRHVVLRRQVHCGVHVALVVGIVVAVGGRRGGVGSLAEFLAGVRRTVIEAGRYKVGWTRLSEGGRKRSAAAVAAGPGTGSRGQGASLGEAGDAMAEDWTTAWRMPPRRVLERVVSPPAPCRLSRTRRRRWLRWWGVEVEE